MLSRVLLAAHQSGSMVGHHLRRNLGISAVVAQKAAAAQDPIQQLFVSKIREYAKQSQAAGGKLVGASAEVEQQFQDRLDKIATQYGATGPDFLKFPTLSFTDPTLEAVGVNIELKTEQATAAPEETLVEEEKDDKYYWQA